MYIDANDYGFSPENCGSVNATALQNALNQGGTVQISKPGVYDISRTVFIGSNTSLIAGNNVFLRKTDEEGGFSNVILNKGAMTKTYDEHIVIENLHIIVNHIDHMKFNVFGLRGHLAFHYVKDVKIIGFRCMDLEKMLYGIHVCTFEDLIVDDVIVKGDKDGVHLGRGTRFTIRNGIFETYDDAIALNAHDYDTSNPELGWIENGVVENCHDLKARKAGSFFCRILAGAWVDWYEGMEVQKSDTVISNGRVYRVKAEPDETVYKSMTQPSHEKGEAVLDGITWVMVQEDVTYTAGVRNVTFRDIFLERPRTAFSIHFDNDKFSRSYYPSAKVPVQKHLVFDNIRVGFEEPKDFIAVRTPIDYVTICNSSIRQNPISFYSNEAMQNYGKTTINVYGCIFNEKVDFIQNHVQGKEVEVLQYANIREK
ncbi:MAG: hypothetical protein ACI4CT_01290 [Lachnospiraceae bacterium]